MQALLEILLSNAVIATGVALFAMFVSRYCRQPAILYGCWFLVLLKLVTPSLVRVPISVVTQDPFADPVGAAPQDAADGVGSHTAGSSAGVGFDPQTILAQPAEVIQKRQAERRPDDRASTIGTESSTRSAVTSDRAALEEATAGPLIPLNRKRKSGNIAASAGLRSARQPIPWGEWALGAWAAGSIVYFSVIAWRLARFSREIRRPWPIDDDLQRQADILARRFGLSRSPAVKLVNASVPPMLYATRRPATVLLPRALMARLSPEQKNALLAHEIAHYCRHDHWVRWFEVVTLGLYWWHPVAWFARRELQRAEELCCDAWVLWALPEAGQAYARAILETVDFLSADCRPAPALASGLGPVHPLERRFEMILHARSAGRLNVFARSALVLLGLMVLPFSAGAQVSTDSVQPASASKPEAQTPSALPRSEVTQTTTTERSVEPAAPSAETPLTRPPTTPPTLRETQGVVTTYSGTTDADVQNRIEIRLSRLEKMMDRILSEVKDQPGSKLDYARPNGGYPPGRFESGMSGMMSAMGGSNSSRPMSLSDLKKQRIDVEDELEKLQDRMAKIDEQIAKLQSAHPAKESRSERQAN